MYFQKRGDNYVIASNTGMALSQNVGIVMASISMNFIRIGQILVEI